VQFKKEKYGPLRGKFRRRRLIRKRRFESFHSTTRKDLDRKVCNPSSTRRFASQIPAGEKGQNFKVGGERPVAAAKGKAGLARGAQVGGRDGHKRTPPGDSIKNCIGYEPLR